MDAHKQMARLPLKGNNYHFLCVIIVRGAKTTLEANLALASMQSFIIVSIAPESPDSNSARCQAVTLGELELFLF